MSKIQLATFGGGCFWCVEAVFQDLKGVLKVVSGYSGGQPDNPTYREICTGTTGHAEVVQITFDADIISFETLCRIFFTTHDPTTLNRQGADRGTQYRSVIFYHTTEQATQARAIVDECQALWDDPIVTEISMLKRFFAAEGYHQNYFKDHGEQPYCQIVIEPKVKKMRKEYLDLLK
jgi:peptide-methionine (S)-S-oxide reductase